MRYDEAVVDRVRNDPLKELPRICEEAMQAVQPSGGWNARSHAILVEAYAFLMSLDDAGLVPGGFAGKGTIQVVGNHSNEGQQIAALLGALATKFRQQTETLQFESIKAQYAAALGKAFSFEFSQGDLDRVQALINELRKLLTETPGFEDSHRRRLLLRLERLQAELHKRMSDLDHFWGLVGDAGVALGKLGENAKPLVDRFAEIVNIVWRTQAKAEELPSGASLPQLGHDTSVRLPPQDKT
jgi:hypothetical protein